MENKDYKIRGNVLYRITLGKEKKKKRRNLEEVKSDAEYLYMHIMHLTYSILHLCLHKSTGIICMR